VPGVIGDRRVAGGGERSALIHRDAGQEATDPRAAGIVRGGKADIRRTSAEDPPHLKRRYDRRPEGEGIRLDLGPVLTRGIAVRVRTHLQQGHIGGSWRSQPQHHSQHRERRHPRQPSNTTNSRPTATAPHSAHPGSPKIGPTRKAKSAHCPPSRLHRSTHPPACKDSVRVSPASSQPRRGAWPRGRRPMLGENLRPWDLTVRAECLWRRATGGIVLQLARVATAANRNGLPMTEARPYSGPYWQMLSGRVTLRCETPSRRALPDQAEAGEGTTTSCWELPEPQSPGAH
jgi:hypothetical protein